MRLVLLGMVLAFAAGNLGCALNLKGTGTLDDTGPGPDAVEDDGADFDAEAPDLPDLMDLDSYDPADPADLMDGSDPEWTDTADVTDEGLLNVTQAPQAAAHGREPLMGGIPPVLH